ncbi:titin isoform X2 [Adelges cooleyi]|uniref:titin isoform X2 n=1 Tax=Adelges cooleyi TaxID=133065 RepID=UPI0021808B2E|nr:titin isoform X2 [Adelges cooleyi]
MDLRWILIIALLAVRGNVSYSGSTGHHNTKDESSANGSPPNDDVEGPSVKDGNFEDDSRPSASPEPENIEEKGESPRKEISIEEVANVINEQNDVNRIDEIQPDAIAETPDTDKADEDTEDEISVEEETATENKTNTEENDVEEANTEENDVKEANTEENDLEETISIIIDENLVKDNADILIDVKDFNKEDNIKISEPENSKADNEKINIDEEIIKKKNVPVQTQTFKGTKKRNPKYWKFDPDEFPLEEETVQVTEKKRKKNPKYWKFDPDEDELVSDKGETTTAQTKDETLITDKTTYPVFKGTKKRNPKYWKFDPDEFPLEEETVKVSEKKRKRNPKYWKFDPDEEESTDEKSTVKATNVNKETKSTKKSTEPVFKGTKKRNPKYWKFDPEEFPQEEEIKVEPVKKGKRNPKFWKFDPDENPEGKEPEKDFKVKVDTKENKYSKVEKSKLKLSKEEQIVIETKKKNKYWKTEETEEEVLEKGIRDESKKEEHYSKTDDKPEESNQAKLIDSMYWKIEDEKPIKRESREAVKPKEKSEKKLESIKKIKVEVQIEDDVEPEDDLTMDEVLPKNLRNKSHIKKTLKIGEDTAQHDGFLSKVVDTTLKELKKVYEVAIKPLETTFKYKDLSNRHFGEPEIFSKPLVLFMGPWSGGKSSIINYLLDIEYSQFSLRTGAEPSPAYFNILMYSNREAILDGTQLAADWTFSGLQKFGQGLLDRLRGLKLPHPLLEKVNIVEIPGIMEMRKYVDRVFPFNDVCQWFIDRADVIFLVYDPAKLDVGPETEAILDQLKGREYQTRIILNKADKIRAEELMRIQGTLIWNISPLMSSAEPPTIYSVSLWSNPYETGSPAKLLHSQELAFLRDIRSAIDKRVENKIASARRFAVRVRNHAKMVDCYLTTYYNHKSIFGNKKTVSDDIIEHPQNYHIYEGLSTLTNISRYDLPDPDVYRDFFRLNPVYEFKRLSETCTYFRGCPINKLDMAIAYDLPDLIGQYKRQEEELVMAVENAP